MTSLEISFTSRGVKAVAPPLGKATSLLLMTDERLVGAPPDSIFNSPFRASNSKCIKRLAIYIN